MKARETAVVLIEFQNDFCKEDGKLYPMLEEELARQNTLANAAKLLEAARGKGALVVHCPFVYDPQWVDACGVCGIIAGAAENGAFLEGRRGAEIIDELKPRDNEPVLEGKRALSAFSHTRLDEILKSESIRNVVLAGFLSNVCVESTARSAYDLGYRVFVIRDATAATSQANQEYVEREIYPLLGGSMTAEEFLGTLE